MALALIQEFEVGDDRSTTNYDAIRDRLNVEDDPPPGLIAHTAGFDGGVFRIFDVWETEDDWVRFRDQRLTPVIEEVTRNSPTGGPPPDRESTYELHDIVEG